MKIFKMKTETLFVRVQSFQSQYTLTSPRPDHCKIPIGDGTEYDFILGAMQRYHALQSSSSFSIFLLDKINDGGCYHSDGC